MRVNHFAAWSLTIVESSASGIDPSHAMITSDYSRMPSSRLRQFGFSILELMVTLSISAVLLGLALPSMQSFLGDSEITATSNHFVYSLQLARSEAIKRAGPVGVCPSAAPLADEPTCSGNDYTTGWIVFFDDNGNGSREAADQIVLQSEARSSAFTIVPDDLFSDRIYFGDAGTSINPAGIPISGNVRIEFAVAERRDVMIAANGRVSTVDPDAP